MNADMQRVLIVAGAVLAALFVNRMFGIDRMLAVA